MFTLCHYKDDQNNFILFDQKDLKEIAEHLSIEIEKEISFEELDKDYSFYALIDVNDLLLRALSKKSRTATHVLDEQNISCWIALKNEFNKIQEKKSKLSKSQRDLVVTHYNYIIECSKI